MVFFTKNLERTIIVHPMFLGPLLRSRIKDQLIAEVEGKPVDSAGFIVTVLGIEDSALSKGLVDALTGFTKYKVQYKALMFRPFKNEVLDCEVKTVSDVGFFAEAGPLNILVSSAVSKETEGKGSIRQH
jgi:DNA-directed RNA polymerase II subunit RPB7